MKKALLWESEGRFGREYITAIMIDNNEITRKVDLSNELVYLFTKLAPTAENEAMLNVLLPELNKCDDRDEIEELIDAKGIAYKSAGESETVKDILCYFRESKNIGNLTDCESQSVYTYLDSGSDWKELWLTEDMTETEVEYDDENYSDLDELDENSNFYYIHKFEHARKYPVFTVDGEKVEGQYLVEQWSQYQGSLPTGKIVDSDWSAEQEISDSKLAYEN